MSSTKAVGLLVVAAFIITVEAYVAVTSGAQRRKEFHRAGGASGVSVALSATNKLKSGSKGTGEGWIDPSAPVNSEKSLQLTVKKSLEGANFQKRLSLLGSTGSIGTQTLEIVDACPDNFVVDALSAGTNSKLMAEQVMKYKPKIASMSTPEAAADLKTRLQALGCTNIPEIVHGPDGILAAATVDSADTVVTGIVGAAGLQPTIEAIKLKKDIALANKETLISGGPVINPLVEQYGVNMVREHFQKKQGIANTRMQNTRNNPLPPPPPQKKKASSR
jgi:1-deoxy-D-xylulose-5-phosphate reductoisomerase